MTTYDWLEIVKYLTYCVQNELGGHATLMCNALPEDPGVTIVWERYDAPTKQLIKFNYKIDYVELESVVDPKVLAEAFVNKCREAVNNASINNQKLPDNKFPRSRTEKREEFRKHSHIEHWMYVGELMELLKHLKVDDWVTPNNVHNLTVSRLPEKENEDDTIGAIDFATNRIEFFNGLEDVELLEEEING